uniref:RHS repeat-associated core domain-containing protein n=1 Tax=Massilia sp. PWRC2 TaxID=2804626 RepID=UPI003CFA861C
NLAIQVAPPADTVTYIHTDALGSPVARSDSAGNVISRTSYEPYGRTAGGVTPTIGFTGHVNDADTGLVYMQQRYYDPVAGRFLSVDPVTSNPSSGRSFNRYRYSNNNPYRYVDPDGRDPDPVIILPIPVIVPRPVVSPDPNRIDPFYSPVRPSQIIFSREDERTFLKQLIRF